MSVAFRRESDEEHLEPKFAIPIPPGPNLVTRAGLALIAVRVAELEASGDQEAVKRDLTYWRARLATAQPAPSPPQGRAAFGSRVECLFEGTARAIEIVGSDEADPARDRIAFTAPLARALIGAEVGDLVAFAGRVDAIEVTSVTPIEQ